MIARTVVAVLLLTTPLYAEVVRAVRTVPGARILAVTAAPLRPDDTVYTTDLGLDAAEQVGAEFAGLRLRRLPTLVIVDRRGIIIRSWEGAPPAAERRDFAATVRSFAQR